MYITRLKNAKFNLWKVYSACTIMCDFKSEFSLCIHYVFGLDSYLKKLLIHCYKYKLCQPYTILPIVELA